MKILQTEEVLKQHIQAVKDWDLERIAFDYAEDAIFIFVTRLQNGTFEKAIIKGKESIQGAFKNVFTQILPAGSSMEFTNEIVEGEIGYITWSAKSNDFIIPTATDTFIIRDGKIIVQTGLTISDSNTT